MKKVLLVMIGFWGVVGLYTTVGPGKEQATKIKELVAIKSETWKPDKATRKQNCRLQNKQTKPDPGCTPGATTPSVRSLLCLDQALQPSLTDRPGKQHKKRVLKAYRIKGVNWRVNLLIPARLGGTTSQANLWPIKKRLQGKKRQSEMALWKSMCAGKLGLAQAQKQIADNWKAVK